MDILIEVLLIVLGTYPVNAIRCVFADVAPALFEIRLVEQLVQIAEPMLGLLFRFLRYALQEGWH